MKASTGLLILFLAVFTASSCTTIGPPVIEEEEVEQEEEDGIREWLELHDLDLYRPWRSMDEAMDPFKN